MPSTKCKIKFSKVLQSLCMAKSKNKSDASIYTFSGNRCFKSSFESHFQEAFLAKVIYTIKYTTCAETLSCLLVTTGHQRVNTLIIRQDKAYWLID